MSKAIDNLMKAMNRAEKIRPRVGASLIWQKC